MWKMGVVIWISSAEKAWTLNFGGVLLCLQCWDRVGYNDTLVGLNRTEEAEQVLPRKGFRAGLCADVTPGFHLCLSSFFHSKCFIIASFKNKTESQNLSWQIPHIIFACPRGTFGDVNQCSNKSEKILTKHSSSSVTSNG